MGVPDVTLYGASGHTSAVAFCIGLPGAAPRLCNVVAFLDDMNGGGGIRLADRPVVSWEEWTRDYLELPCLVAIGSCHHKKRLVEKVATAGGSFARLYDDQALRYPEVSFGDGAIVFPQGYIAPNTVIGDHVQVMPMHLIGHDVVIERFSTISPSVTISGYVSIGEGAFIGAGATVLNGRAGKPLRIGAGAVVAAGAVVTKSVPPGTTVMGNPARPLRELAASRRKGRS